MLLRKGLYKAKQLLVSNNATCVIVKDDTEITKYQRGIAPLLELYDDDSDYSGAFVADKVVGRGAAFIYLLLNIKAIYCITISRVALNILIENGIDVEYDALVDNIKNRSGNDICPIEKSVLEINNPEIALEIIRNKYKELNGGN